MSAPGTREHFNGVDSTYQPNPEPQSFTRPGPLARTLVDVVHDMNLVRITPTICYCVDCDDARIAADNARWSESYEGNSHSGNVAPQPCLAMAS